MQSLFPALPSLPRDQTFSSLNKTNIKCDTSNERRLILKKQLEQEIQKRVREVLKTPPIERMRRAREKARKSRLSKSGQYELNLAQLNTHLNLSERQRRLWQKEYLNDEHSKSSGSQESEEKSSFQKETPTSYSKNNKFDFLIHDEPSIEPLIPERKRKLSVLETAEEFNNLTLEEKQILFTSCTKMAFKKMLGSKKSIDGCIVKWNQQKKPKVLDSLGIERDRHGPFWPKCTGPMFPSPKHIRFKCIPYEPVDSFKQKGYGNEKDRTWRTSYIVFDSETSPRSNRGLLTSGDIPVLLFESRFESGNLRQARRIGNCQYELILQNDLFTKRHTQWYYFRVTNTQPGILYEFTILNLLKPSSLYEQGMKPLLYSEKMATIKNIGWHRVGWDIKYTKNVTSLQHPMLANDVQYYQMEFTSEFPYADDICYLAHTYPYTFTDLKKDLEAIESVPDSDKMLQKNVLCETRNGNSCFLLTITNKEGGTQQKPNLWVSARVHPGETQSSWIMKGLLDWSMSDSPDALEFRNRCVLNAVPMLNPDGVILGNYRCSMSGRDMNRNYRHPRKDNYPTVYHMKQFIKDHQKDKVLLYCDFHGHSRKQNVFTYGCDSSLLESRSTEESIDCEQQNNQFLEDRLFPFIVSSKNPGFFNLDQCRYRIEPCKESTARVVFRKELNIRHSFTLEATFCGTTTIDSNGTFSTTCGRHLNYHDFESVGHKFGESLLTFLRAYQTPGYKQVLLQDCAKDLIKRSLLKIKELPTLQTEKAMFEKTEEVVESKNDAEETCSFGKKDFNDTLILEQLKSKNTKKAISALRFVETNTSLNADSSSDSNSDSEPESPELAKSTKQTMTKRKSKVLKALPKNKKMFTKKNNSIKTFKKLPDIGNVKKMDESIDPNDDDVSQKKVPKECVKENQAFFVNKYKTRSNGGIPCFTAERLLQRSSQKFVALLKQSADEANNDVYCKLKEAIITQAEVIKKEGKNEGDRFCNRIDHLQKKLDNLKEFRNVVANVLNVSDTKDSNTSILTNSEVKDCTTIGPFDRETKRYTSVPNFGKRSSLALEKRQSTICGDSTITPFRLSGNEDTTKINETLLETKICKHYVKHTIPHKSACLLKKYLHQEEFDASGYLNVLSMSSKRSEEATDEPPE